jgi:hypothetical protein
LEPSNQNPENQIVCQSCGARIKESSSHCHECKTIVPLKGEALKRKEEAENLVRIQFECVKENLIKLHDSGNFQLVHNFIKRYPDFDVRGQKFSNLKTLLANKGILFTDLELMTVVTEIKLEGQLEWVKIRILYNNPTSSDECIKNYIEVFGGVSKSEQKSKLIDFLVKILKDNFNYQGDLASDLIRIEKQVSLERFENRLKGSGTSITINEIDKVSGYDFEHILKELFLKMGYGVVHTNLSKDQGADLIVEKFGVKTVIQAKNWTANVGNSAIQEVTAAIKHYDADRALVISSSGFTQSAIDLARSNNIELWDRSKLSNVLDDNPVFRC